MTQYPAVLLKKVSLFPQSGGGFSRSYRFGGVPGGDQRRIMSEPAKTASKKKPGRRCTHATNPKADIPIRHAPTTEGGEVSSNTVQKCPMFGTEFPIALAGAQPTGRAHDGLPIPDTDQTVTRDCPPVIKCGDRIRSHWKKGP